MFRVWYFMKYDTTGTVYNKDVKGSELEEFTNSLDIEIIQTTRL